MEDSQQESAEPHTAAGSTNSKLNWLRASVLGSNDGIVSLAALVVGVAGASPAPGTLLVTGIAGLLAGALSMAVGEYVSVSSQRDSEQSMLDKEHYELEHFADHEFNELVTLYIQKGLKPDTANQVVQELTNHDAFRAHVDMELHIDPENLTSPWQAAFASAVSFTVGAIVPLVAILLSPEPIRIPVTFAAVLAALIVIGVVSAKASGARLIPATTRVVVGGILAMLVTFGIGRLFKTVV